MPSGCRTDWHRIEQFYDSSKFHCVLQHCSRDRASKFIRQGPEPICPPARQLTHSWGTGLGLPRRGVWEVDLSPEHQLKDLLVWLRPCLVLLRGEDL